MGWLVCGSHQSLGTLCAICGWGGLETIRAMAEGGRATICGVDCIIMDGPVKTPLAGTSFLRTQEKRCAPKHTGQVRLA